MKKVYALVMILAGKDPAEHIKDVLTPHLPTTNVPSYCLRPANGQFRVGGEEQRLFDDDVGAHFSHVKNPFPRLSSYLIGGRWAGGLLPKQKDGLSVAIKPEELYTVEKNSVSVKEFPKNIIPNVLIKEDGVWISQNDSIEWSFIHNKIKKLIADTISFANPETLLTTVELTVEPAVERNCLIAYP